MPWTNITNAQLAVGAPIRSVDLLALRDNIVALGNQEAGAPTLVKSLNGQTGAITNTGFDTIGSYARLANATNGTGYLVGATSAGSNLYRANTIVSYSGSSIVSNGNNNGIPPFTVWNNFGNGNRGVAGNSGYILPLGASTVSGTWRAMTTVGRATSDFDGCNNRTDVTYPAGLWVRIS